MKVATFIFLLASFLLVNVSLADDGLKSEFKKFQMNINDENYIMFEDNSLVLCDRSTDEYLLEITEDSDLFIRSKKIRINSEQRDLIADYYEAQKTLFIKRNSIGAKGVEIGLASAKLAAKAVGGTIELIASGFDENVEAKFEQDMEREAKEIEYHADNIEDDADEYSEKIDEINSLERKIHRAIEELDEFDLSVDEDRISF